MSNVQLAGKFEHLKNRVVQINVDMERDEVAMTWKMEEGPMA